MHPDLLTRTEAAIYLRVSRSWLAAGNGPSVIRMGGKVFYSRAMCDEYIKELMCRSTSKSILNSGGVSSVSTGSLYGSAREKQIAATLQKKNAGFEQTPTRDRPA